MYNKQGKKKKDAIVTNKCRGPKKPANYINESFQTIATAKKCELKRKMQVRKKGEVK